MENLLSATTSLAEILEAGNLPPSLPQVERSPCPSPLNIHHHPSPSLYSCFKYPSLLSKGSTSTDGLGFTIDSAHAHTAQSPLTGPYRDEKGDKSKITQGQPQRTGWDLPSTPRMHIQRSHPSPVPVGTDRVTSPNCSRVNLSGRAGCSCL